jgi:hypothetical protein
MFMLLAGSGAFGLPLGVPPLPEEPVLARAAPEECLVYFSSAGMARANAQSSNQTERLFAEPEVRHLAAEVEKLIRGQLKEATHNQPPQAKTLAEEGPGLLKVLLTRPLAAYVSQINLVPGAPPKLRAGAVLSLPEDADQVKASLERCLSVLVPSGSREVTVGGATFYQLPLGLGDLNITWGVKDKFLYVATGEDELEALLKRAGAGDGSAPKWLAALHKHLPVQRVSTVSMVNVRALTEQLAPLGGPTKVLEAIGVSGIDRLAGVTGLDREGLVSRSLVSLRGEPQGVLELFDQKPLTAADLDLVPRDATMALAWKLDAQKAWTRLQATIDKIEPSAKEELTGRLSDSQRELIALVLQSLGDTWCVFDSPSAGGMFIGVTAVVSIKNGEAAASLQKKLIGLVESAGEGAPDARQRRRVESFTFAGKTVHVLDLGANLPLAPAWCLTDNQLVVGLYPEAIKAFLARNRGFQSLSKVPEVMSALADGGQAMGFCYTDTRRLFDLTYPFLPVFSQMLAGQMRQQGIELPAGLLPSAGSIRRHLRPSVSTLRRTPAGIETVSRQTLPGGMGVSTLPVAAGLLLPAVQKVRAAADRVKSANNLKQIALAMHNYHDTQASLPPAYRANKDGKALLSWRVLILPYIEQKALYDEFHLDEPWDSPHNKKLIARMPEVYHSPASHAAPGMTNYLTVRGADTAFPGEKGVRFADITDGLSNTIMIVEASDRKAVIWTRPDDFEFNEKNPIDGLVGLWPNGFQAALCDGSVRVISATITPKVLKDLFIRNDGNPLPPDF